MADDVNTTTGNTTTGGAATAVAEKPADEGVSRDMRALAAEALAPVTKAGKKKDKKKKEEDDDLEYEVEFATPFGKIEFEFEPLSKKQKKDAQKKERAERDAAKAAAKAAKLAEKRALKGDAVSSGGGRGGTLLIALIIFGIVAAAVIIAVWLFARPGEDEDAIPAEFRADDATDPEPVAPQGFVGRVKNAVRAGKQASRDAQAEQQRKFEQMSGR